MTEQLPKDELYFRTNIADLWLNYGCEGDQEIANVYRANPVMIQIFDADLSISQARELRDWLNKVLP